MVLNSVFKLFKNNSSKKEIDINRLMELLENKRWQTRYNALASLINIGNSSALETVKKMFNEDENEHVRELAVEYLKLNNSFPLRNINAEDVILYSWTIVNTYTIIGNVHATSDPNLLSANEAKEDIKFKLKQEAAQLGANAVINIKCGRNLLSSRQFEAKGLAVLTKDPDEKIRFVMRT